MLRGQEEAEETVLEKQKYELHYLIPNIATVNLGNKGICNHTFQRYFKGKIEFLKTSLSGGHYLVFTAPCLSSKKHIYLQRGSLIACNMLVCHICLACYLSPHMTCKVLLYVKQAVCLTFSHRAVITDKTLTE